MTRREAERTHMPIADAGRSIALAALIELTMLTTPESARAESDDAALRYRVTVRQVEGTESVPAHMVCARSKVCRGLMSISAAGGHMRVLVIAMIDGGYAYFRFHAEERDVSCGRPRDFVAFALGPPPISAHGNASLCDAPPSSRERAPGPAAEPPVLRNITPPLATLRIDLSSIDSDRNR